MMIPKHNNPKVESTSLSGFTLIEAVLTMVVLSIIGLTTAFVVMESMTVYARTTPALDASYQARLAVERIQRDVRAIGNTANIKRFSPSSLAFDDSSGSPVDYQYTRGNLTRNGDLIARGVTNFTLRYWRSDGSQAATHQELHLVEIDLTVRVADQDNRLLTTVYPRSLGP